MGGKVDEIEENKEEVSKKSQLRYESLSGQMKTKIYSNCELL